MLLIKKGSDINIIMTGRKYVDYKIGRFVLIYNPAIKPAETKKFSKS